jgi:hypothetical protein
MIPLRAKQLPDFFRNPAAINPGVASSAKFNADLLIDHLIVALSQYFERLTNQFIADLIHRYYPFDVGARFPQLGLDNVGQRMLSAGACGACPGQPHFYKPVGGYFH